MKYLNREWLLEEYLVKKKSQQQIATEQNVHVSTIELNCKKFGIKGRKRKYQLNEGIINDSNPFMWYFLGLFCTDGWWTKNAKTTNIHVHLSSGNPLPLIEEIKAQFGYEGPLYITKRGVRLTITSQILGDWLLGKGVLVKEKTYKISIAKVKFPSKKAVNLFFRGVVDGDGNIKFTCKDSPTLNAVRVLSASKVFIEELCTLLSTYYSIKTKCLVTSKGYFYFSISKAEKALEFLSEIYSKDYPKLRLYSKYCLYRILKMMI